MVNKTFLVGNVGNDPEIKQIKEGVKVAKFSLATSENYTKNGEKVTNTEWHNIVCWNKLADLVEKYVKKGSQLFIEGKINNEKYEKDGQTKYITNIIAKELKFIGKKPDDSNKEARQQATPTYQQESFSDNNEESEIPF